MCNQTVGLVQAAIEREGIATVSITLLREVTSVIHPPRSLFVPFPMGYPLGAPHDAALQHRVIAARELFRGTLTQTAVYPREVARQALQLNAAAVILAHNHPSGVAEPSTADRLLTDTLRAALGQLDIAVLDHLIVAGNQCVSFAERGWL